MEFIDELFEYLAVILGILVIEKILFSIFSRILKKTELMSNHLFLMVICIICISIPAYLYMCIADGRTNRYKKNRSQYFSINFKPFYQSDRLVKYADVEANERGYDVNLILVDPREPISAKDYVVQTWETRLDFLNSQVRSVGCDIISSNDTVDQLNIIYTYKGEKANFIYDSKMCLK